MKDEILEERIKENEELFTEEELKCINDNIGLSKKIYLLGILDGIKTIGKNLH